MQKTVELYERWKQRQVEMVKLGKVAKHDALQPRAERLVPFKNQGSFEKRSKDHIVHLRGQLEACATAALEPVLLVEVAGKFFVVDGHHRWQAHKLAKRREIPARVLQVPLLEAVRVSKLVNTGGVKLPMHREQKAEACWQSLVMARQAGEPLPSWNEGTALFGLNRKTVGSQIRHLDKVKPSEYPQQARDPMTGWPLWKYVKETNYRKGLSASLSSDQMQQKRVESLAKRFGKVAEEADPEDISRALQLLGVPEQLAQDVAAALAVETDEDDDERSDVASVPLATPQSEQALVFPFEVSPPGELAA